MYFLFLEFLGTTEILVIAVVALIVFGPRKLPEYAKKIGKMMNEFKTASREFKETWEKEAAINESENTTKSISTNQNDKQNNLLNEPDETSLVEIENRIFAEKASEIAAVGAVASSPMIKEIDVSQFSFETNGKSFDDLTESAENHSEEVEEVITRKRDWL